MKPLSVQPTPEFSNEFEFKLPLSKHLVRFKLMSSRDEQFISDLEDRRKKMNLRKAESTITTTLSQTIISVNGITDRDKITKFVQKMPARDARALRKYMADIAPNVELSQNVKCKFCDNEADVTIPMTTAFFWPDVGK
jgi:hypothetical protein